MRAQSIFPRIPTLDVILVTCQKELNRMKRFKGYTLPDVGTCVAKAIHLQHTTSHDSCVIIYYPSLLEEEEFEAMCTLLHEGVHAWDFISDHFGYGADTELRAYSIESIFRQLVEGYGRMKKLKENRDARGA